MHNARDPRQLNRRIPKELQTIRALDWSTISNDQPDAAKGEAPIVLELNVYLKLVEDGIGTLQLT